MPAGQGRMSRIDSKPQRVSRAIESGVDRKTSRTRRRRRKTGWGVNRSFLVGPQAHQELLRRLSLHLSLFCRLSPENQSETETMQRTYHRVVTCVCGV